MRYQNAPPPVNDAGIGTLVVLHQTRPLQVDEQPGDEPAPEPTGDVRHLVPPPDAEDMLRYHEIRNLVVGALGTGHWHLVVVLYNRLWFHEAENRPLDGQHGWDETLAVAQRQSYLKTLQQLEVLLEELAWEALAVAEDERNTGLIQNAIVDKSLLFGHCDDFSKHVSQPDGVDEVQIVEAPEVVIVVQKDPVVMEKLGSCSDRLISSQPTQGNRLSSTTYTTYQQIALLGQ